MRFPEQKQQHQSHTGLWTTVLWDATAGGTGRSTSRGPHPGKETKFLRRK